MTFLYLPSNTMGHGDDVLGKKLLVSFLRSLAASEVKVDAVGCVNSGVFLTTEDGESLDALRALEAKGARIASCGTCLDYHGRRDALRVGAVGAMPQTIEIMASADRVIRP